MLEVSDLIIDLGPRRLVSSLSFTLAGGEIAGLKAPSGSGKSVLLRWMLGALPESFTASGSISIAGEDVTGLPTEKRNIGLLLQQSTLFPHLSVAGNLSIALPARYRGKRRQVRISEQLKKAGLAGFERRDPATLSGGERARVALVRSLMAEPVALLLDEPFSALDAQLRAEFREWVYQQTRALNIPALVVSHDEQDLDSVDKRLSLLVGSNLTGSIEHV